MNLISRSNGHRGTLLSWDPLSMFDDLLRWEPPGGQTVWSTVASPVRVESGDGGATITVDVPGVAPEDVDLTFDAGTLTITGKRGEQTYRYSVTLGDAFDPDGFEAQLAMGVLTVRAKKRPEAQPRKIAINAAAKALRSGD